MSRPDEARDFCKEGAQLSDPHLSLIVGSAITPEVARERGYRTITTKAELERYGFAKRESWPRGWVGHSGYPNFADYGPRITI
jgi:hypothetical protein